MLTPSSLPSNRFQFLSSPLPLPLQFSFLFLSSTAPPLFSSHLLLAQSPENEKGGQLCHNLGFFLTASGLSGSRTDVVQTKTPSKSRKTAKLQVTATTSPCFFFLTNCAAITDVALRVSVKPLPVVLLQIVFHVCRQSTSLRTGQILKRWR